MIKYMMIIILLMTLNVSADTLRLCASAPMGAIYDLPNNTTIEVINCVYPLDFDYYTVYDYRYKNGTLERIDSSARRYIHVRSLEVVRKYNEAQAALEKIRQR